LKKLGIAIAANRPIMATTIMISTNVKPALRDVLVVFIAAFRFLRRERTTGGLYDDVFCSLIACCNRNLV